MLTNHVARVYEAGNHILYDRFSILGSLSLFASPEGGLMVWAKSHWDLDPGETVTFTGEHDPYWKDPARNW